MIVPKRGTMNLHELSKEELIDIIRRLMQRVSELESQLAQNSSNTSKPPSSDPLWKRGARKTNSTKSSGRKPGGQKGHKGYKFKKFEHPDKFISHELNHCPICGSHELKEQSIIYRQVLDIP